MMVVREKVFSEDSASGTIGLSAKHSLLGSWSYHIRYQQLFFDICRSQIIMEISRGMTASRERESSQARAGGFWAFARLSDCLREIRLHAVHNLNFSAIDDIR